MCEFSCVNVFAIGESLGFAFFILAFTAFIYLSIRRVKMAAAQHIINEIEAKEVELLDQIEALKALDVQRNADKLFGAPPVPGRTRWRYESPVGHEVFWILVPSMIFLVLAFMYARLMLDDRYWSV
jgi:hypothetical protein